jgi:hypothetical protein
MVDGEQCPRCGKGLVVRGSFGTRAVRFGFRPEELAVLSDLLIDRQSFPLRMAGYQLQLGIGHPE